MVSSYETKGLLRLNSHPWISARGSTLRIAGKQSSAIDFTSGILCTNLGHRFSPMIKRMKQVIRDGLIHSYAYPTKYRDDYFSILGKTLERFYLSPSIHLASSGTEVVEAALRISLYNGQRYNKNKILSISGNYHGRSMGASMLGSMQPYSTCLGSISDFFPKVNFPYRHLVSEEDGARYFRDSIGDLGDKCISDLSAFFIESFQGWAAAFYPSSYIKAAVSFCKQNNILVVFDEMQSGFYRTGKMFCFEHYKCIPDLICMGKGMGGGSVIAGLAGEKKLMDLCLPGEMSSTHSANPLSCAAACAVLETYVSHEFQRRLKQRIEIFERSLSSIVLSYPFLSHSSIKGMVAALVFDNLPTTTGSELASLFHKICADSGLLMINTGRESIKLAPPLNIPLRTLHKALDIISKNLSKLSVDLEMRNSILT